VDKMPRACWWTKCRRVGLSIHKIQPFLNDLEMRLQQQHEKDEYVVKTMRWDIR